MDSLKDLLTIKNLDEPTEVTALREYYKNLFKDIPVIKVSTRSITLIVPNGKIATEIRARTIDIERRCQFTKRFVIRVG